MTNNRPVEYPVPRGLSWHPDNLCSSFTPMDWHRFAWSNGGRGEINEPDISDPPFLSALSANVPNTNVITDDPQALAESAAAYPHS